MTTRNTSVVLWVVAFILTVILAVFQRMTGPSYPLRGEFLGPAGQDVSYRLPRTHGGPGDLDVSLALPESVHGGELQWRRYPTGDSWTSVTLILDGEGRWTARLPHQPPAGKLLAP